MLTHLRSAGNASHITLFQHVKSNSIIQKFSSYREDAPVTEAEPSLRNRKQAALEELKNLHNFLFDRKGVDELSSFRTHEIRQLYQYANILIGWVGFDTWQEVEQGEHAWFVEVCDFIEGDITYHSALDSYDEELAEKIKEAADTPEALVGLIDTLLESAGDDLFKPEVGTAEVNKDAAFLVALTFVAQANPVLLSKFPKAKQAIYSKAKVDWQKQNLDILATWD